MRQLLEKKSMLKVFVFVLVVVFFIPATVTASYAPAPGDIKDAKAVEARADALTTSADEVLFTNYEKQTALADNASAYYLKLILEEERKQTALLEKIAKK